MNKYLKQVLDFILFSNVFIALCALSQGIMTYWFIQIKPDNAVLAILFFSTLAIYNFSILLAKPKDPESSPFLKVRWIFKHYRLMLSLSIISILSLIALSFFLSLYSLILLFILGSISIAYNLPIWGNEGKKYGIRSIPGLKLFIIGIVWAGSTVLLPVFELENNQIITFQETLVLFLNRFLFIVAITIPFDIRDLFQDKQNELKTIPVIFGEKKSLWLCQFFLFSYLLLIFLFSPELDANFWALSISIFITGWLIFKSRWEKNEYYYFLWLDGTMILQVFLLFVFNSFS